MNDTQKRMDITSADTKQLGFEYQYLYFFLQLFSLKRGDEVGYEALEDVHKISSKEGIVYLYQLKHTNQTTQSGIQMNLTELSGDLWKTLSNWSKLITDTQDGRGKIIEQKKFLQVNRFVFVSNRVVTGNTVNEKISDYKIGICDYDDFIKYLDELLQKTINGDLINYIKDVKTLNRNVLDMFLKRIDIINSEDDLFEEIRNEIRSMMVPEKYVNDVLAKIYLKLKEDFFEKCKNRVHQVITYENWLKGYGIFFNEVRTTMLPFRTYQPKLPEHLEQQIFVKELVEIGAINELDIAEIAEFTNQYICLMMQLEDWSDDGRLTEYDLRRFHKEAITLWHRIHNRNHRTTGADKSLDNKNALNCFDEIMEKKLQLFEINMGIELSNGEFISLANESKIGWKYFWKDVYRNNGN